MSDEITPSIFLETKEYKRFKEFCDACIEYQYIGICYGTPGVGKTQSAEYYSQHKLLFSANPNEYAVEDNLHITTELSHCRALYYIPIIPLSPAQMINGLNQNICYMDQVVPALL